VFPDLTRKRRSTREGREVQRNADCSGYLCVAFVRIINVNLS